MDDTDLGLALTFAWHPSQKSDLLDAVDSAGWDQQEWEEMLRLSQEERDEHMKGER